VDFESKIIDVLPTLEKPSLKNERSLRTIPPFENIWPVLKALRKESKGNGLLFSKQDGSSWFDQKGELTSLSTRFSEALKAAGVNSPEPARRLRRWWETTMRAKGLTHLIDVVGGHSKDVGLSNYTDRSAVAKAAKVGWA